MTRRNRWARATIKVWNLNAVCAMELAGSAKTIPISHGTARAIPPKRVTAGVLALRAPSAIPVTASIRPKCPERNTFVKVCNGCHPPEVVLGRRDTPKNWARKVD
jgi:hypothetical protein